MPQHILNSPLDDNKRLFVLLDELLERFDELPQADRSNILSSKETLREYLQGQTYHSLAQADVTRLVSMIVDAVVLPKPIYASPVSGTIPVVHAERFAHGAEENEGVHIVNLRCNRCDHSRCCCRSGSDSFWFWMWMLSGPRTTVVEHHHYSDGKKKEDPLLAIVIFLTVVALLASAIVASIYLFGQIADAIERLVHNEGRSYAAMSMGWFALSAAAGFSAASYIVPMILAATAAANPVAWGIFGTIMLGIVLTSLTHMIFPGIIQPIWQKDCEKTFGETSFEPKDMGRIQLTEDEKANIANPDNGRTGKDPLKVAFAITLLRRSMGPDSMPNQYGLHAFFDSTKRKPELQSTLEIIRALRQGDFKRAGVKNDVITIGNMKINLNFSGPSAPPIAEEMKESVAYQDIPVVEASAVYCQ